MSPRLQHRGAAELMALTAQRARQAHVRVEPGMAGRTSRTPPRCGPGRKSGRQLMRPFCGGVPRRGRRHEPCRDDGRRETLRTGSSAGRAGLRGGRCSAGSTASTGDRSRSVPQSHPAGAGGALAGTVAGDRADVAERAAERGLMAVFEAAFRIIGKASPGEVAVVSCGRCGSKTGAGGASLCPRPDPGQCDAPQDGVAGDRRVIELSNGSAIEIATASFRSLRGYSVCAAIFDEIAFWYSDGANPDAEMLAGIRPATGDPGGKLIALSSPVRAARRALGRLSQALRRRRPVGCWWRRRRRLMMNPTLDPAIVADALGGGRRGRRRRNGSGSSAPTSRVRDARAGRGMCRARRAVSGRRCLASATRRLSIPSAAPRTR